MGDVVSSLQRLDKLIMTEEIIDAVRRLESRGQANLSEEKTGTSFFRNLADVEANAPFWIAVISTAAVLLATFLLPQEGSWVAAKRIIGAVFLFVMPGYVTANALIARNSLSYVERIALSAGVSLAIISFVGLALAYSSVGVRLVPTVGLLAAFVVAMSSVGSYKNFLRRKRARELHIRFLDERAAGK